MINPNTLYIIGFGFSLLVYQLGWSDVYPPISVALIIFLIVTMIAHFFMARFWMKKKLTSTNKVVLPVSLNPWIVTGFIYFFWLADFIHEGGVPLFKMIMKIPYDYKEFGFPSLHVFTVTFSSFYCIYLLHYFLRTKNRVFLFLYFVNLASAILIYNRGMLCINLISSVILYLLHLKSILSVKLLIVVPVMIIFLYLFGVIGTTRVSFEAKTTYDKNLFLESGEATIEFRQSNIPKEFFWSFFYISSPLANLQTNINTYSVKPITIQRVLLYINNEWLFESLSKRINKLLGVEREKENTIKEQFNASTVYSRSYSYLGWSGVLAMGVFVLLLPFFYNKMLINNPYQIISIALLCTVYLFLAFDNTIRFMGLSFQLVYPIVFPYVENKLGKIRFLR